MKYANTVIGAVVDADNATAHTGAMIYGFSCIEN